MSDLPAEDIVDVAIAAVLAYFAYTILKDNKKPPGKGTTPPGKGPPSKVPPTLTPWRVPPTLKPLHYKPPTTPPSDPVKTDPVKYVCVGKNEQTDQMYVLLTTSGQPVTSVKACYDINICSQHLPDNEAYYASPLQANNPLLKKLSSTRAPCVPN